METVGKDTPFLLVIDEIINGNIDKLFDDGRTLLMSSVCINNINLVKILLENGANPNILCKNNYTPLTKACERGYENILNLLLEYGANPNINLSNGMSPLMIATEKKDIKIMDMLVKSKADLNYQNYDGNTALIFATIQKFKKGICYLVSVGAKIDICNNLDITPFYISCFQKNIENMNIFLGMGANINKESIYGLTPLITAINEEDMSIIKYLVKNRVDIDKTNKYGLKSVHYALMTGNYEIIYFFNRFYPRIGEILINNEPCIFYLIENRKINQDTVHFLLKNGLSINSNVKRNNLTHTILTMAIEYEDIELVKILVKNKVNINYYIDICPIILSTKKSKNGDKRFFEALMQC